MAKPIYRRVLVKVSGEALMGPGGFGIHQAAKHTRVIPVHMLHNSGLLLR